MKSLRKIIVDETLNALLARHHSPSFLITLKFCPRRHHIRYGRGLDAITALNYPMLWGRMYHRAVQAVDGGENAAQALDDEAKSIRLEPTYLSSDTLLVDRARDEVLTKALPAYRQYLLGPLTALWDVVDLEREIFAEIEGLKVKCIPDKIVEVDGRLWVVERKTTARDDRGWERQWGLNFQTTLEAVVAEQHYGREVHGVWVEQVLVTRKRKKDWPDGVPQEIHRIECKPPRPVDKSEFVKREAVEFVRGCVEELKWRYRNRRENDPNYLSCARCDLYEVCKGKVTADEVLVKRAER